MGVTTSWRRRTPPLGGQPTVFLDISRLASRLPGGGLSGLDRVELAYAQWLLGREQEAGWQIGFVLATPWALHLVPKPLARAAVAALTAVSTSQRPLTPGTRALAQRLRFIRSTGRGRSLKRALRAAGPAIYFNVAHSVLERPALLVGLKAGGDVFCIVLVHDLIPLRFPELTSPGMAARHRRRLETACGLADHIVVNSAATAADFADFAARAPRVPPISIAHLGIAPCLLIAPPAMNQVGIRPYFVALGNLEPRKNHLLLLTIWRRLVVRLGSAAPQLRIVGRRSADNAQTLWMLDRCTELRGHIIEHPDLGDEALAQLLRGARALLSPSFVEGFGLPVAEALALGTPVICSDIPSHREIGQGVPDFLDPLDGLGWEQSILDYAAPDTLARAEQQRRSRQLVRLGGYRAPRWDVHFALVEKVILGQSSRGDFSREQEDESLLSKIP